MRSILSKKNKTNKKSKQASTNLQRYWGTAAEWQVHRDGLQRMIAARGGFAALQSNWQLGLVTYL